ncbi:MAG: SCO family protein [Deltaproteobacteria bacterium]|nr:SCO family protein [Deltaproteobacteria bacterium]
MRSIGAAVLTLVAFMLAACGQGSDHYETAGKVVSVNEADRVIKVAHEDIPGFMPAMTMNFDVAPGLPIAGVHPGDEIRFTIERTSRSLRVTRLQRVRAGAAFTVAEEAGRSGSEDSPLDPRPAPEIRLVDQAGQPFSLETLRGRAVLLDFIFTSCTGPCPILTGAHARLQQRLPADLRARVHLLSVTVDPANDTPEKLTEYARSQGADLTNWTFLTGETDAVQEVLSSYHVGSVRLEDGSLNHTVVTYLIGPDGNIRRYYLGLEHAQEEVMTDLLEVLS